MEPSTDPVPEEETKKYSESDSSANRDCLDQVIEDLMQAETKGYIKIDNAHTSCPRPKTRSSGKKDQQQVPNNLNHQICKEQQEAVGRKDN